MGYQAIRLLGQHFRESYLCLIQITTGVSVFNLLDCLSAKKGVQSHEARTECIRTHNVEECRKLEQHFNR